MRPWVYCVSLRNCVTGRDIKINDNSVMASGCSDRCVIVVINITQQLFASSPLFTLHVYTVTLSSLGPCAFAITLVESHGERWSSGFIAVQPLQYVCMFEQESRTRLFFCNCNSTHWPGAQDLQAPIYRLWPQYMIAKCTSHACEQYIHKG